MCGIAGFLLRDLDAQLSTLETMCDRIRHRGPDDEGFHIDGSCGIGMRRLSIIDLHSGHQPISNEDQSIWVVFNGEIYNFQQLRAELSRQGHKFQTCSDTEVLVHLYEEEGPCGLSRLRGMFAFALWDSRKRRLLLARDRFGKKPLYFAALPDGFFFGSELKCLQLPNVPLDIDREALKLYFQFRYIPDPYTAFLAIRRLPAGSWLTCDVEQKLTHGRYWKLPAPNANGHESLNDTDVADVLRSKFDEAVKIRMMADVPLGAFLSGGLDSSSVVASMAIQSADPVKTFSIGFEEADFNELTFAALVAKKYKTEHHEIVVRPDSVSLVERLVHHFDEPFGDPSAIPTFIVSQFAAQHVKVVLTGDGGDEMFGGYESFFEIERRRGFDRLPQSVRRALSYLAESMPYSTYGKNYLWMAARATPLERYFESNYAPYSLRRALLQPDWMLPDDINFLVGALGDSFLPLDADVLSQAMYFEATANLTGDMLVKVDRMSMANSLEVRCPLLDHQLAEMAMAIPSSLKIQNGAGKQVFIKALGERLPRELLSRRKMGFGVPLATWFRGPLRSMLWDHLTDSTFRDRGIVSSKFVLRLLEEHQTGRRDNREWLWSLLMFDLWLRGLGSQSKLA